MRFLSDAGISPKTVEVLIGLGYQADHVRALDFERRPDRRLVERATVQGRVMVTFRLDFGDILALGGLDKPSTIILRLEDERAASVSRQVSVVVRECAHDLESGPLTLVEDTRHCVRKPPIGGRWQASSLSTWRVRSTLARRRGIVHATS